MVGLVDYGFKEGIIASVGQGLAAFPIHLEALLDSKTTR